MYVVRVQKYMLIFGMPASVYASVTIVIFVFLFILYVTRCKI